MNMRNTFTPLVLLAMALIVACGSNKDLVKANEAFKNAEYSEAAELYKKALPKIKKKDEKMEVNFKAAECYRRNHDYKNAETWYKKVTKVATFPDHSAWLYLADVLKAQEKYDEATVAYGDYKKLEPGDVRGENGIESCKLAQKWKDNPTKYSVENVTMLNTKFNDWGVAYTKKNFKEIVFTSSREGTTGNGVDGWLGQSFEDVFEAKLDKNGKWSAPTALASPFNSKMNEGAPASNNKYNLLYFTRCGEKKDQTLGCQVFLSKKKGATAWDEPTQIVLAADSFSCGDPALSPTEDTLFFASDMPGGQGGSDIWFVTYDKKKKEWSSATNLGSGINTPGNERFPYLHDDGTFYFSSDGHLGMGGLDLFVAKKDGKKWSGVSNLRYPLNSSGDDFGIVFQGKSTSGEYLEKGYLSSNRKGGKGGDDIYQFMLPPPCFTLQGVIRNDKTNEVISNAKVVVNGSDGTALELMTDASGSYMVECKPSAKIKLNTKFDVTSAKADYLLVGGKQLFNTENLQESKDFVIDFRMTKVEKDPIKLPKILYETAKWDLQPQYQDSLNGLIKTLNDNPNIVIKLRSHTDSRSGTAYNDDLSLKRAKSVVDYLVLKGIAADRMVPEGRGERELLNKCKDGVKCTDEEHQENRRTDFTILRYDYVPAKDPSTIVAPKIELDDEEEEAPAPEGTTPVKP